MKLVAAGFEVETKCDQSPVTVCDRAAEPIILARSAEAAPGVPVIAEEEVAAGRIPAHGDTYFLVDPLDGTKEFVRGGDDYTVNIGLIVDGIPRLGVVYQPAIDRLWGGLVGEGAFVEDGWRRDADPHAAQLGDERAAVASKSHLTQATVDYLARRSALCDHVSVGSSLKFCIVAEGRADIYPRLSPTSEWDTAAGHAVLLAAGGRVDGPDGRRSPMARPPSSTAASAPPPAGKRRHRPLSRAIRAAAATCRRASSGSSSGQRGDSAPTSCKLGKPPRRSSSTSDLMAAIRAEVMRLRRLRRLLVAARPARPAPRPARRTGRQASGCARSRGGDWDASYPAAVRRRAVSRRELPLRLWRHFGLTLLRFRG